MRIGTNISALYNEFADALTEVLAENSVGPARRGRWHSSRSTIVVDYPLREVVLGQGVIP